MKAIARLSIFSALLLALAPIALADGIVLYNTIPSPLPPNLPSFPYEADASGEFGGLIQFANGNSTYTLTSTTVVLSDQSYLANWSSAINGTSITASGYTLPITLNLYNVGSGNTVGALIATETIDNAFIPWRPDPTAGCGNDYLASDGLCHSGSLSTITFDLANISVPDTIIYGLAFNTTDYGADPTGALGPYDSLNFALATTPPTVGSNPLPDTAYLESSNAGDYNDGGAGGTGAFRQDIDWSPYSGAVEFSGQEQQSNVPEPSSLVLLSTGLLGLAGILRRRRPAFTRS
jgi:hypothetical protein